MKPEKWDVFLDIISELGNDNISASDLAKLHALILSRSFWARVRDGKG